MNCVMRCLSSMGRDCSAALSLSGHYFWDCPLNPGTCPRLGLLANPGGLLFKAQRGNGIDAGGAAGGNPDSQQRHRAEQERCDDEGRRIPGPDSEEETGQEMGEPQRSAD